ncbi:MAG TPA: histidine phosphatase family protein [Verrucomicrobiae bacterium]|nr:histidine phosphatase family protein [Verrucomicrobiae bacterium]
MSILVARHGLSEANNRDNYGTPAFGNPEAPLMPQGREQATELGEKLTSEYGFDLASEPVAVSMMRRTQDTAITAGSVDSTCIQSLMKKRVGSVIQKFALR